MNIVILHFLSVQSKGRGDLADEAVEFDEEPVDIQD